VNNKKKLAKHKGSRHNKGSNTSRRHWYSNEDQAIIELTQKYGTKHWAMIAKKLEEEYGIEDRNGKQCRERWHNHLNSGVSLNSLSQEEQKILFTWQREYGNKWAEIAKHLKGRTDNVVKNYYYATLRRQIRKILKYSKCNKRELPTEISLECIQSLMLRFKVPYSVIDNPTLKEILINMNDRDESKSKKSIKKYHHPLYLN
jgi:ATP-dependent exoDNAse (exonuclease V) alpha subunit